MKNIKPLSIWSAGQTKTAEVIDARIVDDNMSSSAVFFWVLKEADTEARLGEVITQGNTTMGGQEYQDWNGGNDYAYAFIAGKINVELID
jgi:hypothetical protein